MSVRPAGFGGGAKQRGRKNPSLSVFFKRDLKPSRTHPVDEE